MEEIEKIKGRDNERVPDTALANKTRDILDGMKADFQLLGLIQF